MTEVSIPALFSGQIRISGISISSRSAQEDMVRAIEVNRLQPVIDRTYGLHEIAGRVCVLPTQSHFGKVVLQI